MNESSLGELFYLMIDELEDLHYLDALASLVSLLMDYAFLTKRRLTSCLICS